MVDRTSQIWIVSNLHRSFLVAWLTVPTKYGASVHDADYLRITKHLYGSIRKFIVFVCLYMNHRTKTTVVCCNPVFRHDYSHINHRTALHVRVGLALIKFRLHNQWLTWLGTRQDWLGLCSTITHLGYATGFL